MSSLRPHTLTHARPCTRSTGSCPPPRIFSPWVLRVYALPIHPPIHFFLRAYSLAHTCNPPTHPAPTLSQARLAPLPITTPTPAGLATNMTASPSTSLRPWHWSTMTHCPLPAANQLAAFWTRPRGLPPRHSPSPPRSPSPVCVCVGGWVCGCGCGCVCLSVSHYVCVRACGWVGGCR